MVIAQSADSFIENFCSARKGKGLKFALNVKFWIENCFPLKKKNQGKDVCFLLVSNVVEKQHFRICCRTNSPCNENSEL